MGGSTVKDQELGAFSDVDATDADDFIERLDQMRKSDGFRQYKRESFDLMRIGAGSRVADIGCGAGDDVRVLSDRVGAEGMVYGIDISKAMVEEARERFGDRPNTDFMAASIETLPIATASLDAIRVDRVLIHVPDPWIALRELLRVLRPGGRLVVSEPDMVGLWVSSDDPEATGLIVSAIANSCRHPYLPRDMGVMLRDLDLHEVEHSALAMVSDDFETIDRVVRFELAAQGAAAALPDYAERLSAWMPEQRRRKQFDRFSAGMCVMTASATKP